MLLTIILQKKVSDLTEAEQKVKKIKEIIAQLPDVKLSAQVNTNLEPPEE